MKWTIKQTTEQTGLSADTLRYYDKEGILSPKRHENGYRYYDEADIMILKNIVVMKYARFSLAEMKHMEELFAQEPNMACHEINKQVFQAKIAELNQTIGNYQKIICLMNELLSMIDNTEVYLRNKGEIAEFINQIFEDIRRGAPR